MKNKKRNPVGAKDEKDDSSREIPESWLTMFRVTPALIWRREAVEDVRF